MGETRYCRACGVETEWVPGTALRNTVSAGVPDFPGDDENSRGQTLSYTGPPEMVTVRKCGECGRSIRSIREDGDRE